MTAFEASVRHMNGTAIIDLQGEIDARAEAALTAAYGEAMALHPAAVALNFGGVEYINSTGIALIVGILAQARKGKLPVSTYGLSEHYTEIFQITRLADFMSIYPDEYSALSNSAR